MTLLLERLRLTCFASHQSKRRRTPTQTQSFSPWETMTVPLGNTGERKRPGFGVPHLSLPWPRSALSVGWSSHFSDDPPIIQIHFQEAEEEEDVPSVWTPPTFKHYLLLLFVLVFETSGVLYAVHDFTMCGGGFFRWGGVSNGLKA